MGTEHFLVLQTPNKYSVKMHGVSELMWNSKASSTRVQIARSFAMNSGVLLMVGVGLMAPLVAGDEFCANLNLSSATLPNTVASSRQHMGNATLGRAPDVVYVLAFCRGDITTNDSACGDCVAAGLDKLKSMCLQGNRSAGYYGDCFVYYSGDQNILAPYNATALTEFDMYPFEMWNIKNITGGDDDVRLIGCLVHQLLAETAQAAAGAARRFATGVMDSGRTFPLMYSLAQCSPELSAGDCLGCLSRILGMINSTMSLRIGAQIGVLHCYFRYEAYPFYAGDPVVRLGPSAPAPAPLLPTNPKRNKKHMSKLWAIPMVVIPLATALLCFIFFSRWRRRYRKGGLQQRHTNNVQGEEERVWGLEGKNSEFSVFDFDQVLQATHNFSEENKLGEGGFGAVYKGQFSDGSEIAVKRLASHSGQGFIEFKNEVQLIAKLQHRNLVRLFGCCSQGEEKILIYEYLPNKSLDFFIFDENKRALLDWYKCLAIIEGIAHGILYLHKHSRLSVIHRDLKPSNILLDNEMNPKISDFGLAKIFSSNDSNGNTTRRVVGTYGYMPPEYASEGLYSIKSDVFSFGVLILEIISGKRNSSLRQPGDFINLLGYAWQLWEEERWIELVDASLARKSDSAEMMRCINIGLLCVQENAADRPTMSEVVAMLSSKTMSLGEPKYPAYFHVRVANEEASSVTESSSIIMV